MDALENRHVVTVDIEGAYLHADITNEVIVELDPVMAAMLVQIVPEYRESLTEAGKLFMKLLCMGVSSQQNCSIIIFQRR